MGHKSRLGWLIVLPAVLIAAAVFGAASIERSSALHAADERARVQGLLTAMLDQETGTRGFFQTEDQRFLQPWYKGSEDFVTSLARSRMLIGDDAALRRLLNRQAAVAGIWHANAAAAIHLELHGGVLPTVPQAVARKKTFDQFRAANYDYGQLVDERRDNALTQASLLAVLIAGSLSLGLAAAVLLLLRRSARRTRHRREGERELRELLQVSESEAESRSLLVRHIERALPGAAAAVLNRNNSDDRLEPSLNLEHADSPLRDLPSESMAPRACLAVRLSRTHTRTRGEEALAECAMCGKLAADIVCEPLLVGGKVIGSVLVAHEGRVPDPVRSRIRDAVVQAAPIIANQRNLSLAEMRAASDALTGLPNRRAADDTLKRMAAHAGRNLSPLSALLIDLDHFKTINDIHGHEAGDEALAAVGGVIASTLRSSDFAARFGGEEFLVLLPDTDRNRAVTVAEKLRTAIQASDLRAGRVTASIGIATIPQDAADPEQVLRKADRALYVAKHLGRNRVEFATHSDAPPLLVEPHPADDPPSGEDPGA